MNALEKANEHLDRAERALEAQARQEDPAVHAQLAVAYALTQVASEIGDLRAAIRDRRDHADR